MLIVEKNALPNGAHRNQSGIVGAVPEGWLCVPPSLEARASSYLPFIHLTLDQAGTITAVAQGQIPPPAPIPNPAPTVGEQLRADVDYLAAMAGVIL